MDAEAGKYLSGIEIVKPEEIELRSMEIIRSELGERRFSSWEEPVILRVIHATADFDFADNLRFSPGAAEAGIRSLLEGADVITDTNMAKAGIRRRTLENFGGTLRCFMADKDVAEEARRRGITRASASMEHAARLEKETGKGAVIALGNAPTALIRLHELIRAGEIHPKLVIGAPVGFVNVTASKELFLADKEPEIPWIIAAGRKGGSTVACAIVNALLIQAEKFEQQNG